MPSRLAHVAAEMCASGRSWRGRAALLPHFHCSDLSFVDFIFSKTTFSSAWIYGCRVFTLLFCFVMFMRLVQTSLRCGSVPGACPALATPTSFSGFPLPSLGCWARRGWHVPFTTEPAQSPSHRCPHSLSSGDLMNRLLDFFPFQAMNKT